MRFLTDQDLYQVAVTWLRGAGHDVATARDCGLQRAPDRQLLEHARATGRIMVTRDKDFGALVFLQARLSVGVILLRMSPESVHDTHEELHRLLSAHPECELATSFCVVEPHRHRLRHLPTAGDATA